MRYTAAVLLVVAAAPVIGVVEARRPSGRVQAARPPMAQELLRSHYVLGIDSLTAAVSALTALPEGSDAATMRAAFRRARRAYKHVEFLVADLLPEAEVALNGAPLPRPHETVVDATWPPTGFQVIEGALFPSIDASVDTILQTQARLMQPTLVALRTFRIAFPDPDARVFDAVRQEIARVSTLGLAGFDATASRDGIVESAEALRGVRVAMAAYHPAGGGAALAAWQELDRRLGAAVVALEAEPRFERFDRLAFLVNHANPTAEAVSELQRALALVPAARPTAWYARTSSIFDPAALDPFSYAPSDAPALHSEMVALGRRLFFDPRLSVDGRRSCTTCHQPDRAFTDGRSRALVDPGRGPVRNTPTLLNAGLQPFQFADSRARALEDQVAFVLENPREMNLPLDSAASRLQADTGLAGRFAQVYHAPRDEAVTPRRVQTTLAAFVRSLVAMDSRFDRAIRGDTAALSPKERRGFNLFMGKAACATCHFLPTFGGSLPPSMLESEPEVIGVPTRAVTSGARLDPDPGVAGFDHAPIHRHAFKTPSLRNVALTAPFMHNGVYRTLDQVVDFYNRGGGAGIGIELENQTLSPEPLDLTGGERRALVAFMRALTDSSSGSLGR